MHGEIEFISISQGVSELNVQLNKRSAIGANVQTKAGEIVQGFPHLETYWTVPESQLAMNRASTSVSLEYIVLSYISSTVCLSSF